MFEQIINYLRELNVVSIMLRFLLAIICGGIIGIERGKKKQAAGFRTHILVCMGAAIAMMTGQYISDTFQYASDPARLGAQVISGIGFLGVGTIIVTQSNKVRGLTTAAGLWTAACIGIGIGIGFYEAAIIGTIFVILTMVFLQKIDEFFYAREPLSEFFIELENVKQIKSLINNVKRHNLRLVSMEMRKSQFGDEKAVGIVIMVKKINRKDNINIFEIMSESSGVIFVEELT